MNVRSRTMPQAGLHLVGGVSPGDGGSHGDALAGLETARALRRGAEKPRGSGPENLDRGRENAMEIAFVVPGVPVGKGRPKFARRGNFVTAYTPEKTASYENLVKVKAQEAMGDTKPLEGAVGVSVLLSVTPPASWSQKKQRAALAGEIHPTSKPDVDNVIKGLFDAMNEIVWRDDKQACSVFVQKKYSDSAYAWVTVSAL